MYQRNLGRQPRFQKACDRHVSRECGDCNDTYPHGGLQPSYPHKSIHLVEEDITYQENVEMKGSYNDAHPT
jgi:hypothetical protein